MSMINHFDCVVEWGLEGADEVLFAQLKRDGTLCFYALIPIPKTLSPPYSGGGTLE